MINRLTLLAGAIVGALLSMLVFSLINATVWLPKAEERGRERLIAEQAVADRKAEIERKRDDKVLRGMSDFDICVDGLKSRKLPITVCDELRGI